MKNVKVTVDFNNINGKIKAMHGVGQPPQPANNTHYHYLTEAGIPYSRLHDVGGWMGGGLYVDIPNIFRDFDADVNDPASYDFAFTDRLINNLLAAKCEPYFRLGVTIENLHMLKYYRLDPPKDNLKWAQICEHIIAHYTEGWANGFEHKITYWEIWNEPDDCYKVETAAMWKGTPEQYFKLYSVTAKHLKERFGEKIKIGAFGHCGVYEYKKDKDLEGIPGEPTYIYDFTIQFLHGFMKHIVKENAPLDFFSWHVYDNCHPSVREDFKEIRHHADYVRAILDHYGYNHAEHHLNEWNLWTKVDRKDEPIAAAKSLAFMLMMQKTSTDVMCYYDARMNYGAYSGMFNPDTTAPYRNYYAFSSFNSLYKLKNQVETTSTDDNVQVGGAVNGVKGVLCLSNVDSDRVVVELDVKNFATDDVDILLIDNIHRYCSTGRTLEGGKIALEPNTCMEIRFLDLSKK